MQGNANASSNNSHQLHFDVPSSSNQNSRSGNFANPSSRTGSKAQGSSESNTKRPRANTPATSNRLKVTLKDAKTLSIPIRLTAPAAVKEAVIKFNDANAEACNKKTSFGEVQAKIPVTKVAEFETFIQAHSPGVELDFDTPRSVLDRLNIYHNSEVQREARGDVIKRPLDELLPSKVGSSLMEFQWHGVHFAMKHGGRCLIGDDMGLGKTIQAIAVARVYMNDWPLLIVCPSSLRLNWKEEILRWLGDDVVEQDIQVYMTGKDAKKSLKRVNIASYDLIRKIPASNLERCQFIIADESHYLKSCNAQRTKIVTPLVKRARRALLLSGTPALSRPVELFSQVNAIAPNLFPCYNDYVIRYCNARQTYWGFDVNGSSNLEELHTILTGTILIRRKKDDVLTQLPEKIRQVTWVETKSSVMRLVEQKHVEFEDAKKAANEASSPEEANGLSMRVKGLQNELYALTAEAKIDSILEFCKDTAESGCKFIVFAHHTKTIDRLDEYVRTKLKLGLIRIDGNTAQADRQALCKKFQQNTNTYRVALLSITAAGVGLTLTKATCVLFAELYWNPGTLLQAEDRAHRIGQRNSILVTYLLAKKTIDESMWKTIRRKLTVVGQSLTGTAAKMEAKEGETTNIPGSNPSFPPPKPFFPEKTKTKKSTQQVNACKDDDVEEIADDGECEAAETQLCDDVMVPDYEKDRIQPTEKDQDLAKRRRKRKREDMFPDVINLTESNAAKEHEHSYVDADLALARKLQQQFDAE